MEDKKINTYNKNNGHPKRKHWKGIREIECVKPPVKVFCFLFNHISLKTGTERKREKMSYFLWCLTQYSPYILIKSISSSCCCLRVVFPLIKIK